VATRIKRYPFEVLLASRPGSAVPADQVKGLDWRARRAARKGKVTEAELRPGGGRADVRRAALAASVEERAWRELCPVASSCAACVRACVTPW
jgi:hypothetical protein